VLRIFKCIDMKFYLFFSRQSSESVDISCAFLPLFPLTIAKLSTLKNSRFFSPLSMYAVLMKIDIFYVLFESAEQCV